MERDGLGVILILLIALILVVGIIVGVIIFLPPSLNLQEEITTIDVGESVQIELSSFGIPQFHDGFYYASDDPEIISVDENGVLTAWSEGKTVIYIQSRSNYRQRLIFEIKSQK